MSVLFVIFEALEHPACGVEILQLFDGGAVDRGGPMDGGEARSGRTNVALKGAIREVRDGHAQDPDSGDRRQQSKQNPAATVCDCARTAGTQGRLVVQDNVAENMAEEDPLSYLGSLAACPWERTGLPTGGLRGIVGAEDRRGIGREFSSWWGSDDIGRSKTPGHTARLRFDETHAGKVEASQEWTAMKVTGAAQIDEKLRKGRQTFFELARELIDPRFIRFVEFPIEQARTTLRHGMENRGQGSLQAFRFLLGVNTSGTRRKDRDGDAKDLRNFFIGERAEVIFKIRKAIGTRENHINGEIDAQGLRDVFKASANRAGVTGDIVRSADLTELFTVKTDDRGAGSGLPAAKNGLES